MMTIPGYETLTKIAESVKSIVYRAIRNIDDRPVILKVFKGERPTPEEIARYKQEYEIVRQLNLESVVKAYDLQKYHTSWVIVLEDFGGESLRKLTSDRQFTLSESLNIALQIADGLSQLHQQNIIHKDINPSNIVLNPKTGIVKLIDFGISTVLTHENPTLKNPNVLEGTLAYMSPEQTGRMNRSLDYHTDFYSLGVTLYELLTGQLPCEATDVMELVHCHLAKQPIPPHELNAEIPPPISDIIIKLLAKTAEDRYQTAYGLKADLQQCLAQLNSCQKIENFTLGQQDLSGKFQIPQKLYGREKEVEVLLSAFDRVAAANSQSQIEMMLVSGYSGIGKTSLVQEIYKPITRQRGYFISGKFDQFQRNIPYSAIVSAFSDLVRQLLTESEAQLKQWREKLLADIGANCQIVIDVIPEVELIVGKQPAVIDLPPTEAQNRFKLVFQKFIRVFTKPEHPLVIFLDDLQWADSASLNLIQLLTTVAGNVRGQEFSPYIERTEATTTNLFLIGAYRDNEVSASHPLILTLNELKKAGVIVNYISLLPLELSTVNRLISDTLNTNAEKIQPLAQLVLAKTQGNPFFMNEFLKSLHDEKLIQFDLQQRIWQWSIGQIQSRNITDNVVELLANKIQKLNQDTQKVLQLAACIGNEFDLQTLAYVSEKLPQEIAAELWEAVAEGLVLPLGKTGNKEFLSFLSPKYKFAHDRIQQATYFLIPESDKQAFHLEIGQLLLQNTPPFQREQKIFDIVNQLNFGIELISDRKQRDELAELNLIASKKAKASAAYEPAFNYLKIAMKFLGQKCWENQYELTLAVYVEAAEAAYLNIDFEQMDKLIEVVLQQARTLLDKVKVYEIKIQAYSAQNKLLEAIKIALQVLKLLGVKLPEKPNNLNILLGLFRTKLTLLGKQTKDLIELPIMTDPIKIAAMRILSSISSTAYFSIPKLMPLITFKQINLSIEHGNASESAHAYAVYGLILCAVVGDIDAGYNFGQLAINLVSRFNIKNIKTKTFIVFNGSVKHWKEDFKKLLESAIEIYHIGVETGDLEFAGYSLVTYSYISYFIGKELTNVEREIASWSESLSKFKQETALRYIKIYQQVILNLMGCSKKSWIISGEAYVEETMLPLHEEANDRTAIFFLYLNKLILCYLFQEYAQAVENSAIAEKYLDAAIGLPPFPLFYFYHSLTLLAISSDAQKSEQKRYLRKVQANQKKMEKWAHHAPMNYLHKFYLVEAERMRVVGQNAKAMEMYDKAISIAKENGYINEEALANELAAKFYLAKDRNKIAAVYLEDARYCYQTWGATAKVKDLDERYPELLAKNSSVTQSSQISTISNTVTTTGNSNSSALDLTTVMKASQSIAGEIVLEKLLTKLMNISIENAGAQTGFLILARDGKLSIAATASVNSKTAVVLQSSPVQSNQNLPETVIKYVERTQEDVVLSDATREGRFTVDRYIASNKIKSILCTPIINQGKLVGILYLENNLTVGAFTPDRLEVLKMLSSQAAISLENALLYANLATAKDQLEEYSKTLEVKVEERTRELKAKEVSLAEAQKLAHLGSWSVDLVASNVTWSEEVFRIFGLDSKQPAPALPEFFQLVYPDDKTLVERSLEEIIHSGKSHEIDYRILRIDGSVRYISAKVQATLNHLGEVVKLFGTVLDITDRKLAEEALRQSETQLRQTLQSLQRTQAQLIQTEKMSGLGQMVAGVAHEINNPVSFIYGNLTPANQYVQELLNLIEVYQQEYPNPTRKVQENLENVDLEFLVEDLQKIMTSMKSGADRIRTIVLSLRNFSRLDESDMKPVDIHEGIDSTLLILQHRLRSVKDGQDDPREIQVIKEYGKLPLVTCYPSQLNQVFMNVLNNAIDALQERMKDEGRRMKNETVSINQPPVIRIRTEVTDANATIRIADNGIGMTEEVLKNIFNPFFTTKLVGSGTGLGLSVCYQIIVDKHGGQISCVSVPGQGAELIIQIPIKPKN